VTIRVRITLVTLLAIALVTGVLVFNGYLLQRTSDERFVKVSLNAKQVLWDQILERHASEMRAYTKAITRDRTTQNAVRSGDLAALQEQVNTTHNLFQSDGTLDRLQIFDPAGNYLAAAPQRFSGGTTKDVVRQVAQEGKVLNTTVRDDDGQWQAVLAFPLYVRGKLKAVVVYGRDIQRILDDFQAGDASDAFFVDTAGQIRHGASANEQGNVAIPNHPINEGGMEVVESDGSYRVNILAPVHNHAGEVVGALISSQDQTRTYGTQRRIKAASAGVILLVVVVLAVGLSLYFNYLFRPIGQVVDVMNAIAGGDLNCAIPQRKTKDETAQLTQGLCAMVDHLQNLLGEITRSTDELGNAAGQLTGVAQRSSQRIATQRQETDQVATAVNEMAATVQEVARNAAEAAAATAEASQKAGEGQSVVQQTIGSIGTLAGDVQRAGEVIAKLQQESQGVGSVLDVISTIAEQTNLLALNAAIEAARAGDKGRGFAVVADEVRTLAGRTQESTEEIKQMIDRLQKEANAAVSVVEKNQISSTETVNLAHQAEQALEAITRSIVKVTEMTTQIATAAEQQSTVAEMISANVTTIAHLSVEAEEVTHDTAQSVDGLTRLGENLKGLVHRFRL
jgi:methyl-accepting chemotaxis protein